MLLRAQTVHFRSLTVVPLHLSFLARMEKVTLTTMGPEVGASRQGVNLVVHTYIKQVCLSVTNSLDMGR